MTSPIGAASIGPITDRLASLCTTTATRIHDAGLAERMSALAVRLTEPRVRVAVGGRLNAGKSTLVNALLHQRLAATGATETTRLVTWFRYANQDRVRVHRRDGSSRLVAAATTGGIGDLKVREGEEIAHLTVETPNRALLARHTIVDTPGLDSLSNLDPDSLAALADADAVVYLMPHPGERDVEAIDAVRSWTGGLRLGAANILGVLSRVDTLDPTARDPWPAANRVAARYAGELRASLSDVVPVAGLLAETALGADFTESDAYALRRLGEVDRFDATQALISVSEFRGWEEGPIGTAERHRLIDLLGLHGCRIALELHDEGARSAHALLEGFARRSGIVEVVERIDTAFVAGADRLRASAAIAVLEEMGWSADDAQDRLVLQGLRSALDRLRLEPALRQIELADALVDVEHGRVRLDPEDLGRLKALAIGPDDARRLGLAADADHEAIAAAADAQIPRWRRLEARPSRALQRHARTARELCEQIYFAHHPDTVPTRPANGG